jgi:hypothetical protein
MSNGGWRARWAALSSGKKILVGGGGALVLLAAIGSVAGDEGGMMANGPNNGQPQYVVGPNGQPVIGPNGQPVIVSEGGGDGVYYSTGGPGGYPGDGEYANGGGGYAPGGGGYNPNAPTGADPDQMAAWEAQQRSQSQANSQFNQYINGTETIRDSGSGEVYSGVDSSVAGAAISGGGYESVPTAELPVAGDP